jgi:hypothetical protein
MKQLVHIIFILSVFLYSIDNAHASFYDDNDFDGADPAALAAALGYAKGNPNYNPFSDISPLTGLANLSVVDLAVNHVNDISALVGNPGIGCADWIYLGSNPLSPTSCNTYIQELIGEGVTIEHDCP